MCGRPTSPQKHQPEVPLSIVTSGLINIIIASTSWIKQWLWGTQQNMLKSVGGDTTAYG